MSQTNQFGNAISGGIVERAVADSLKIWMNTYLGEAERLEGYEPDTLERPLGIVTRSEFEKWPEEQVPVILVVSGGLAEAPIRRTDGSYDAKWGVSIASICSAGDPDGFGQDATRRMSLAYALATRLAIGQHKMLKSDTYPDGFANGSWWTDESYHDLPSITERAMGAARVTFAIGVDSVMTEYAGPRTPLTDPGIDPGNWPGATQPPLVGVTPIGPEESL